MDKPEPVRADGSADGGAGVVFKHDHRSRVWQEGVGAEARVVKRFEYRPLKQLVAALMGIHPAQRERRANRRALRAGLAAVALIDHGVERQGLGIRYWLATPIAGVSLSRRLAETAEAEQRWRLLRTYAEAVAALLRSGWAFKDAKPANCVVDDAGQARWIDLGSLKPMRSKRQRARMLAVVRRTLARAGVSDAELEQTMRQIDEAAGGGNAQCIMDNA